jgi:hypothetical protein
MLVAILLAGATPAPVGPTAAEIAAAIRRDAHASAIIGASSIRAARCKPFEEEPTEFHCEFRAQTKQGAWRNRAAIVTYDKEWLLLDFE